MKTPKQKPFSLPKFMYAVVCSKNSCVCFANEDEELMKIERNHCDKIFSCTHKVVKVSVKEVK